MPRICGEGTTGKPSRLPPCPLSTGDLQVATSTDWASASSALIRREDGCKIEVPQFDPNLYSGAGRCKPACFVTVNSGSTMFPPVVTGPLMALIWASSGRGSSFGEATIRGRAMYLSEVKIENFRCFGEAASRFELLLRPGLTALVGENEAGKTAVIDALRFALGTTDQEWYRLEDSDFREGVTSREIRIICKFEGLSEPEQRAFVEFLTYGKDAEEGPFLYVNWTAKDSGDTLSLLYSRRDDKVRV